VTTVPVRAGDRVQDVLERDLSLVDVFVRHSPHFEKLRSATMRRTMARLVTVEHAARLAGVPTAALVRSLNRALGIADEAPPSGDPPAADEAHAVPDGRTEVLLDLRADLRAGREPFSRIMSAVGALRDDEVLHLRAIFEPAPLYAVLGKRGLAHATRMHASDDWSVWCWRGDVALPSDVATVGEHVLDVRGLEPPEPMRRTLAALETLPPGATLVQVNVRAPQFLLPILAERGFDYEIDESREDRVLVHIRRRP
jgi:TusA-related sulfurtransferase